MSLWVRPFSAVYSGSVTLTECVNQWFAVTGKKQNVVARDAGMSPSKVSDIVTGRNTDPQWSTVERLARGFGVPIARFLEGPSPEGSGGHGESSGGTALADSLRRALASYEATGQFPEDWRGDIMLAIFTLTRALQRPTAAADAPRQTKQAG
jgi:transcriptional regulator with XRE-family HTH domain